MCEICMSYAKEDKLHENNLYYLWLDLTKYLNNCIIEDDLETLIRCDIMRLPTIQLKVKYFDLLHDESIRHTKKMSDIDNKYLFVNTYRREF